MICIGCKIDRPESDFYKDKGYSSGFKSRCKTCHAAVVAEYRAGRKATAAGWAALVTPMIRSRAKRRGVVCTIQSSDIVVPARFPILDVPFVFGDGSHPHAPSVDRRVPSLGYVPGNVAVISQQANRMKSDCMDAAAFRRLADWLDAPAPLAQAQGFIEAFAESLVA